MYKKNRRKNILQRIGAYLVVIILIIMIAITSVTMRSVAAADTPSVDGKSEEYFFIFSSAFFAAASSVAFFWASSAAFKSSGVIACCGDAGKEADGEICAGAKFCVSGCIFTGALCADAHAHAKNMQIWQIIRFIVLRVSRKIF